jgi:hypothetical protein
MQRSGHQLRVVAGMGGTSIIGFDMLALFAMAQAVGLHPWLAAELLPAIESAAVGKMNDSRKVDTGHGE